MQTSRPQNRRAILVMSYVNIIALIVAIILPTSKGKEIYGANRLVFVWAVIVILLLLVSIYNKVNYKRLIISMIVINAYMTVITILATGIFDNTRLSVARIAPLILLIYLTSIRIFRYPSLKLMKILLNLVSIIALIWNIGILLQIPSVIEFSYNNFNQYYDLNGYYQLVVNHKPVMAFGVHTYASYFYFLLFMLCFSTYLKENKKLYLFYTVMYMTFTLFLVSTTAIIFFFGMAIVFIYGMHKKITINKVFVFCIIAIGVLLVIFYNFEDLYTRLYINITNGGNSFISRYSSNSVFNTNFEIIKSSLGIGYNIVDNINVGYSDSGYVVYMTMGHLFLTVSVYYLLYKFLKENIAIYRKTIIAIVLSFEVALPATFNYRFTLMIIFVICYLGALGNNMLEEIKRKEEC